MYFRLWDIDGNTSPSEKNKITGLVCEEMIRTRVFRDHYQQESNHRLGRWKTTNFINNLINC